MEATKKIPVVVICGPTASGKTALSVRLAKELKTEIVSADSMQIYKYMDIGSAKPTADEKEGIVHHMIDVVSPMESYSAAQYSQEAHRILADIYSRGMIPVMVGGTGLYINSVINDVDFSEENGDSGIRDGLFDFAKKNGNEALHKMLREIDEKAAESIHMNNVKRVVRAIEFYKVNGMKISEHTEIGKKTKSRYMPIMLDILWDREKLYDRINNRVDIMLDMGLVDEVNRLLNMGVTRDMTSMQGIGYKEIAAYIGGEITFDDAVNMIKQGSRRYAKRQLTWFRRDDRIIHLSPENAISQGIGLIKERIK